MCIDGGCEDQFHVDSSEGVFAVTHLVVNEVFETITTHSCLTFYNVDEQRQSRSHPFDLISDHHFFTSSFTSDNVQLSAAIRTWQPCRDLRSNNVKEVITDFSPSHLSKVVYLVKHSSSWLAAQHWQPPRHPGVFLPGELNDIGVWNSIVIVLTLEPKLTPPKNQ